MKPVRFPGIDPSTIAEARGLEDIEFRTAPNLLPPVMSSNALDDAYSMSALRSTSRKEAIDDFKKLISLAVLSPLAGSGKRKD